MKTNKKILAVILVAALVLTLMPAVALAEGEPAIKLGAPAKGEKFRFGNVDESWRVLNSGDGKLFVISDTIGESIKFADDNTSPAANVWAGSKPQTWCTNFYNDDDNFSSNEKGAILITTKTEDENYTSTSSGYEFGPASLNGECVFFLSAEEADTYFSSNNDRIAYETGTSKAARWWLRSPFANYSDFAGMVHDDGEVYDRLVDYYDGARPAFNLDLSAVLFSSAAAGGKSSGDVGAGSLKEISTSDVSVWKLTLLDESKDFSAKFGKDAALAKAADYSGWSIPIYWSGAGDSETVSVILCDSSGNALYYGNIGNTAESPDGFALAIPAGLSESKYTLKVFSEDLNGDNKTDYASKFSEIKFTVGTPYTITRDSSLNKYAEGLDNMPSSAAEGDTINIGIHLSSSDKPPKRVYYKYGETEVDIPVTQDGILVSGSFEMPAQNITVYAEWEVPACKVSFETNGGSDVEAQTIASGGTATKPEDPSKDGCTFYKWFGDEACTTPFDFTQAIDGDTTVYAYWLKNISGFKIHTDGTEKGSDGYYNVKADVTEVLFEKDTADVSVDVKPLSKDPADYTDANKLKEAPEAGKEYYFHVELTDVNGQPGRPTVKDNDNLKTGTEATAENATITLMDVAHSVDERVFTMVFKYVENEPEPEPEPDPEPKPDPEPDPEPEPEPEPVVKPVYWVSEGTDLTVSKDTAEGLKLTVHRKPDDQLTYSLFTGVEMGGKQLASSDYTAASGSLKLTVKPSYIKGLAVGSHTLKVKFSDGEVTANVKVTEANDNPRTGDESGLMLWILIAVIAAGGIIAALLVYRKQSKRE